MSSALIELPFEVSCCLLHVVKALRPQRIGGSGLELILQLHWVWLIVCDICPLVNARIGQQWESCPRRSGWRVSSWSLTISASVPHAALWKPERLQSSGTINMPVHCLCWPVVCIATCACCLRFIFLREWPLSAADKIACAGNSRSHSSLIY